MTSRLEQQLREIEQEITQAVQDAADWCPECGHGLQLVILMEGEPEPICAICERPKARGEGIRIIEFRTREEGPQ